MPTEVEIAFNILVSKLENWENSLPEIRDEEGYLVYHKDYKMIKAAIKQMKAWKETLNQLS